MGGANNGRPTGFFMLANDFAQKTAGWKGTEFRVFHRMASLADQEGHCWPSQWAMARDLGLSIATVKRAVRRLVEFGAIRVLVMSDGGLSSTYEVSEVLNIRGSELTPVSELTGVRTEPDRYQNCAPTGISSDPLLITIDKEPILKPNNAIANRNAFESFWDHVPRKVDKRKAETAFANAVKRVAKDRHETSQRAAEYITERMEAFAQSPKGQGQFCPYPATWLNGGRYDDDPEQWQESNGQAKKRKTAAEVYREQLQAKGIV